MTSGAVSEKSGTAFFVPSSGMYSNGYSNPHPECAADGNGWFPLARCSAGNPRGSRRDRSRCTDPRPKSADQRRWRTVGREDSAAVTCWAHLWRGGIMMVVVVVVPGKTLVPLAFKASWGREG